MSKSPARLYALVFQNGRLFCPYTSKTRALQVKRLRPELELREYALVGGK